MSPNANWMGNCARRSRWPSRCCCSLWPHLSARSSLGLCCRSLPSRDISSKPRQRRRTMRGNLNRAGGRRSGFTLVEMILVMVILATLAAIVIPKFVGRGEQARETAAQTDIRNFETALDAFEVDNGFYPKGGEGLT